MSAPFSPFLWPDHAISKTQSREIREEHNALYNSHAELLAIAREGASLMPLGSNKRAEWIIRAGGIIAKAEGRA